MGKHADELGSYQDFRAPWETETGDEAEVDKSKLKKLLYNARSAKAAALDERDDVQAELAEAKKAVEDAKAVAADSSGAEAAKKVERLEQKVADLTAERDKLVAANEERDLRDEVLGGLDPKYAKYVTGSTREELEKSLEQVKEDFGIKDGADSDDDEDDETPKLRTRPRRIVNPADPKDTGGESVEMDFDKIADEILGN